MGAETSNSQWLNINNVMMLLRYAPHGDDEVKDFDLGVVEEGGEATNGNEQILEAMVRVGRADLIRCDVQRAVADDRCSQ